MRVIRAVVSAFKILSIKNQYRKTFTIGSRSRISKSTEINATSKTSIGDDFSGESNTHFVSVAGGHLKIGNAVAFNRNCIVVCRDEIIIGNNIIFGPNVVIYDHDHEFGINGVIHGKYKTGSVRIFDNCWIGANVTILRGTTIGEGSVIGAGSVIKGTIPPHSVVYSDNRTLMIRDITC